MTPEDEISVLFVGDAPEHAALADQLQREVHVFEVERVSAGETLGRLDALPCVDCVVSEHAPPDVDALDLLCAVRERDATLPFVVYTDAGSEQVAAEAIAAGVTGYVPGTPGSDRSDRALLGKRIEEAVAERRTDSRYERRSSTLESATEGVDIVRERAQQASREETLADLYDATRQLIAAEDRQAVCEITIQTASRVLDMGLSGIWLYDAGEDVLSTAAVTDKAHEFFDGSIPDYEQGNSLTWEAFESGELRVFDDLTDATERYNDDTTIRSELIVPLGPHGAMNIGSTSPNDFDDTDIYFIKLLAATTEAALTRSKHDELIRKRERAVSGLHDATRRLMKAETREKIAEIGVTAAKDTLGFPLTLVRFYDAERDALMPSATTDDLLATARYAHEPRYGGCHTWNVYETGEPQQFDDVHEITDVEDVGDLRSLMILPLGDEGTISSGSTAVDDFDELDFDLASILAANMQTALERAQREQHLAENERKLMYQNEQLEEFASVVTHDLRNPLNVAHGRLDLLKSTGEMDHIPPIERAHERMEGIIEDVLLLARRGDVIRDTAPVSLETIVQNAWETVRTGEATLEIRDTEEVEADDSRFQQLIENVLRNSVEHGGTDVRVTVGTIPDGFYVEDDGPGIPPDHRDRIFDSGFTSRGNGTGLGLAIVSRIVDAHDWSIRATDGTNGGARFEITDVSETTE